MRRNARRGVLLLGAALLGGPAASQGLDMSQGGPIEVTATNGIEWRQQQQVVIARGDARAVRAGVTLEAERLLARYRERGDQARGERAAAQPGNEGPAGNSEIWRLEAEGRVRISTATDRAEGDRAIYDLDQAVMVLTGQDLRLTTPDNTLTARDSMEYWPQRRMAVARGNAVVVSGDGRRVRGDTLVGYFLEDPPQGAQPAQGQGARPGQQRPAAAGPAGQPGGQPAAQPGTQPAAQPRTQPGAQQAQPGAPGSQVPGQGSRIDKVEAYGNVEIRTAAEVVRGDRGVYSPVTGLARLLGNVRITRGENTLAGQEAIVNMQTGVARLVSAPGARVQGLVVPGSQGPQDPAQPQRQQNQPQQERRP